MCSCWRFGLYGCFCLRYQKKKTFSGYPCCYSECMKLCFHFRLKPGIRSVSRIFYRYIRILALRYYYNIFGTVDSRKVNYLKFPHFFLYKIIIMKWIRLMGSKTRRIFTSDENPARFQASLSSSRNHARSAFKRFSHPYNLILSSFTPELSFNSYFPVYEEKNGGSFIWGEGGLKRCPQKLVFHFKI